MQPRGGRAGPVPGPVRAAMLIIVFYGLAIFWREARSALAAGSGGELLQAVIGLGFTAIIAWGLFRLERWAWWLAMVVSGIQLGAAGVGIVLFNHPRFADAAPEAGPAITVLLGVSVALSAATLALLLLPSSRRAFRR